MRRKEEYAEEEKEKEQRGGERRQGEIERRTEVGKRGPK